jgi:amino acid permease
VFGLFPAGGKFFLSFPILSCAFLCHFNVLPLHVELTHPTRARMKAVIFTTMGTCFAIYSVVAVLGYYAFRETLLLVGADGGNIIAMFDRVLPGDWLLNVGRIGLCATLLCTIPLLTHPCRTSFMELMQRSWYRGAPAQAEWLSETLRGRFVVSLAIFCAAVSGGALIGNVVVIWSFAGATTAILISFTMPAMFYLKLRKGPIRNDKHKIRAMALLVVSIVMLIICTVEAVLNVATNGTGKPSVVGTRVGPGLHA